MMPEKEILFEMGEAVEFSKLEPGLFCFFIDSEPMLSMLYVKLENKQPLVNVICVMNGAYSWVDSGSLCVSIKRITARHDEETF